MDGIGLAHRPAIQIFVASPPYIREGYILMLHCIAIDDAIAVVSKEVVHIVEIAVPAIEKSSIIPLESEYRAEGE